MHVGDDEHRQPGARAGADQRADVGVALGDDAVERRGDRLVAGQRLQPLDVGLAGMDGGLLVGEVGGALVDVLLRDDGRTQQGAAARQRDLRQFGAGLGAGQIGARLQQLLVEVGRVDVGQRLPGLDLVADVDLPVFHVAADPRIDRRAQIGLQPAGQIQARHAGGGVERDDRHRRNRLGLGPVLQFRAAPVALDDAGDDEDDGPRAGDEAGEGEPAFEALAGGQIRHGRGAPTAPNASLGPACAPD